jgi:arsenite methyltransferase
MSNSPGHSFDLDQPETVSAYDEMPLWSAMHGFLLLRHVPLATGLQALDVGCGTGFPLLELAQRLGPTCTVTGLDPWGAALDRAASKARVWGVENVRLMSGTAEAMPFPDSHFDLIVSNLGLNNFEDPPAALAECRRVSGPSARLALTTNLRGHMAEFYAVFEATLRDVGDRPALAALQRHVDHRATVEGLAELLERGGFRVVKVVEESEVMRFTGGSALLRHAFIRLGFLEAWKRIVPGEAHEETFTRLEADLNRYAEGRGELALTIPMAYVEAVKLGG